MRYRVDALKVQELKNKPDKLLEYASSNNFQDAGMILTFGITSQSLIDMRSGGHSLPVCHMFRKQKNGITSFKLK